MSTGGRVFPSITGGALGDATAAIVQARQQESQAARQDRQIDIAEQGQALQQIMALSDFLDPGTTLGDLGETGQALFSRAFDVDTTGLDDLELKRETLDAALDRLSLDKIRDPNFSDQLGPILRGRLGLDPSEITADLLETESRLKLDSLQSILRDPALIREFTGNILGRDPITLIIPGFEGAPDESLTFSSPTAANIYAQFRLQREGQTAKLKEGTAEQRVDLIKEIQAAVSEANQEVSSTAINGKIIPLFNAAVEAQSLDGINTFLASSDVTEGEKLALKFLMGSIQVGEDAFMRALPTPLRNFLQLQAAMTDAKIDQGLINSVMTQLDPANFARVVDPLGPSIFGFRAPRIEIGGQEIVGEAPSGVAAGGRQNLQDIPAVVLDQEIIATFQAGDMTREELVAAAGQIAVDRALGPVTAAEDTDFVDPRIPEGGFQPDSVPTPFRADAQRLNNLITRRDRLEEGTPSWISLNNVIERLRTRITTGIGSIGG